MNVSEVDVEMDAKCVVPEVQKGVDDHSPLETTAEIIRERRDLPPAHYIFKIENFSLLLNAKAEKFQSADFEVGGYKWNLCLYPNGNKKRNGNGYISLYLLLSNSNELTFKEEVNVNFKLFVYDHIEDKYLTIQDFDYLQKFVLLDANGKFKRFRGVKREWGFDQLVSLADFNDASNGYLMDDCCVFGAEILVIENANKGECLSIVKEPDNSTFTWKIKGFAELSGEHIQSKVFNIGGYNWTLSVYPKGNSAGEGNSLSIFLQLADCTTLHDGRKLYADYMVRVMDQLQEKHFEQKADCEFHSCIKSWGFPEFLSLKDLYDKSKGFIVDDTLIVEVQILMMIVHKSLS